MYTCICIQRPAAKPATVPVQSDEGKHRYVCLSVSLFVCRMYACIYVCMCIVVSVCRGVCRPTLSPNYHRVTRALDTDRRQRQKTKGKDNATRDKRQRHSNKQQETRVPIWRPLGPVESSIAHPHLPPTAVVYGRGFDR